MTKTIRAFCILTVTAGISATASAEEGGHHLPHNHIAFIVGKAYEETDDGHHEDGHLVGIDYVRQFDEHWGWGATFEFEAFGDNGQDRIGVLAIPVSYFVNEKWRIFAAPGIEFRGRGNPDKAMFRFGTGYEFSLGKHFTLAPEAQIDFIAGGTKVYVIALALGYGF